MPSRPRGHSGPEKRGLPAANLRSRPGGRCGGRGPRRAHECTRGEDRVEEGRLPRLRSLLEKYPRLGSYPQAASLHLLVSGGMSTTLFRISVPAGSGLRVVQSTGPAGPTSAFFIMFVRSQGRQRPPCRPPRRPPAPWPSCGSRCYRRRPPKLAAQLQRGRRRSR